MQMQVRRPRVGRDGDRPPAARAPAAPRPAVPPAPRRTSRRPRQSTSTPSTRSRGAAYSSTTAWGASARAVAASCCSRPSGHCSARAHTTSALASPAAPTSASRKAHLRRWLSSSRTLQPGSATASTAPGRPAPEPRSTSSPAARSSSSSRRHQRVGQVYVDRPLGRAGARRRLPVALQHLQQRRQLGLLGVAQPIASGEVGERGWVFHVFLYGETTAAARRAPGSAGPSGCFTFFCTVKQSAPWSRPASHSSPTPSAGWW